MDETVARDLEKGVKKDTAFHKMLSADALTDVLDRLSEYLVKDFTTVDTLVGIEFPGAVLAACLAAHFNMQVRPGMRGYPQQRKLKLALLRKGWDVEEKDRDKYHYYPLATGDCPPKTDHSGKEVKFRLFKEALVRGQQCILVDDQSATGTQILAARELLMKSANADVNGIILGICLPAAYEALKAAGVQHVFTDVGGRIH